MALNKSDLRYFYNSKNKKEAVFHKDLSVITKLAEEEGCDIVIRDHTGSAIRVIQAKK